MTTKIDNNVDCFLMAIWFIITIILLACIIINLHEKGNVGQLQVLGIISLGTSTAFFKSCYNFLRKVIKE
jgi:hypothetical protein